MFAAPSRNRRVREQAPPIALGTLLVASLALRCAAMEPSSSSSMSPGETGAGGQIIRLTPGTGGASVASWPRQPDASSGGRPATGDQAAIGEPSLNYLCESGILEKDCPLPASFCENDSTLASFTDARCLNNGCQWTRRTTTCPDGCRNGACGKSPAEAGQAEAGTDAVPTCAPDDASACELPPSVCLNSFRLLYFANPSCSDGTCRSDALPQGCGTGTCQNGACQGFITR